MKKTSVKPHILSWLQRDPAAGIKPYVFQRNFTAASQGNMAKPSHVISRACLAATTAESLLFDGESYGFFSRIFGKGRFRYPMFLALLILFAAFPGKSGLFAEEKLARDFIKTKTVRALTSLNQPTSEELNDRIQDKPKKIEQAARAALNSN